MGEEIRLRAGGSEGQVLWRTPLRRGTWHDFALRVRWSADPRQGFVGLFHDGRRALPPPRPPPEAPPRTPDARTEAVRVLQEVLRRELERLGRRR